ncbi:hypothetical protein ACS0TY_031500 [Phlomoides rotata]
MDSHSLTSSLSFELRIIRARNIQVKSSRDLFVRCYLPAGISNKRVRLDTQLISSNSNLTWNQTLSLNCSLDEASLKSLKQGSIILELRSRNSTSFMGRRSGSKLVAKAEMPWNDVIEAKSMEIEKWAVMIEEEKKGKKSRVFDDDVKPPAVQVGMKVDESALVIGKKKQLVCERRWDECGCMGECNTCVDYDYFLH